MSLPFSLSLSLSRHPQDAALYSSFAKFEERCGEEQRARCVALTMVTVMVERRTVVVMVGGWRDDWRPCRRWQCARRESE